MCGITEKPTTPSEDTGSIVSLWLKSAYGKSALSKRTFPNFPLWVKEVKKVKRTNLTNLLLVINVVRWIGVWKLLDDGAWQVG